MVPSTPHDYSIYDSLGYLIWVVIMTIKKKKNQKTKTKSNPKNTISHQGRAN